MLRQRLTPDRLQGRVNITAQIVAWGGQPFGAALGGLLADAIDVRIALLVTAGGVAASAIYGWCSPLRRVTDTDVNPSGVDPGVRVSELISTAKRFGGTDGAKLLECT